MADPALPVGRRGVGVVVLIHGILCAVAILLLCKWVVRCKWLYIAILCITLSIYVVPMCLDAYYATVELGWLTDHAESLPVWFVELAKGLFGPLAAVLLGLALVAAQLDHPIAGVNSWRRLGGVALLVVGVISLIVILVTSPTQLAHCALFPWTSSPEGSLKVILSWMNLLILVWCAVESIASPRGEEAGVLRRHWVRLGPVVFLIMTVMQQSSLLGWDAFKSGAVGIGTWVTLFAGLPVISGATIGLWLPESVASATGNGQIERTEE